MNEDLPEPNMTRSHEIGPKGMIQALYTYGACQISENVC